MALKSFLVSSILVAQALAHGIVKIPAPRVIGDTMKTSCGVAPWTNIKNNKYGPIENAVALAGSDMKSDCDLWFCKGFKFEDNASNVNSYSVGQVVNFQTDIENHHPGYCNVSILSTTTKKIISGPLISWPLWGVTGYPWPIDESIFNITIPNLGSQCVTPGACVIMWYWYSPRNNPTYPNGVDQTYQSCIDFTVPAPVITSTTTKPSTTSVSTKSTTTTSTKTSSTKTSSTKSTTTTKSSTTAVITTTTSSAPAATQTPYGQCGGQGYSGPTTCGAGYVCTFSNDWYSQCLPA